MIFYQVNVQYQKQTGEDNPGMVREAYLVESLNCSEAEKRTVEHVAPYVFNSSCDTPQIKKRQFFDIFPKDGKDWWYEAKVELITVDGDCEQRKTATFLIQADVISEAVSDLRFKLQSLDCEIIGIKKSPILDVLRYEAFDDWVKAPGVNIENMSVK